MQTNFLIIGSGISGLNFALNAAQKGKVIIVTKKKIVDSSTNYAQGGIAAVLDQTDDFSKHVEDTLKAGCYHNNKKAVKFMIKHSTQAVYHLIELGVEFAKQNGKLKLTKEGGHQHSRIAYVGDYTGKEIERVLIKLVKEHPNIKIYEDTFALDLIVKDKKCHGINAIRRNKIFPILANQTILATGGIGQLFEKTTNPKISTGDGIAMGIRAGLKTKDMEFIQFHPTALNKNTSPFFLLTEALRGEGAKIVNAKGARFMKNPLQELAPRDIVAREIYQELKNGPVYLDISHEKREHLKNRFPKIYNQLKKYGYNLSKDKIPVTPAVHYICGGIVTDLKGKTSIRNLFAFGEVSCTGVHGANRLASNSLLEALVFSSQIIKNLKPNLEAPKLKIQGVGVLNRNSQQTKIASNARKEIKKIMWEYAGIVRNLGQIKSAAIPKMQKIIQELNKINGTNPEIAETKNMALVSLEILKAAYKRKKSLGCHFIY